MGDNKKQEKKATRKSISLETKLQVIRRLDSGERQSQISFALNLATSTIRTILKNKEKMLLSATATTSSSATRITRSRNKIIYIHFYNMILYSDGEEKQSIREFWKNYNIMNAVENINLSWNEIIERSLKGVWKNIWPDLSKSEDIGHSVDMDEIVELAKQTGLDEVNMEDVEEIVQETSASLSNDELKELTEQEVNKNIDSDSDSDFEEEQKELSMGFVKRSLTTITEIMDQFVENDPNFNRSSKARRGVVDALSTYQQLLTECKRKTQTTLDTFLTKRQKIGNRID